MIRPKIIANCVFTNQQDEDSHLQFQQEFEFTHDDVHSEPWQTNDSRANTKYWKGMDDQERFNRRVTDMVYDCVNDEYFKTDHLLDVDSVEEWYCSEDGIFWEIADGTWRDFLIEDVHRFMQGENVNG